MSQLKLVVFTDRDDGEDDSGDQVVDLITGKIDHGLQKLRVISMRATLDKLDQLLQVAEKTSQVLNAELLKITKLNDIEIATHDPLQLLIDFALLLQQGTQQLDLLHGGEDGLDGQNIGQEAVEGRFGASADGLPDKQDGFADAVYLVLVVGHKFLYYHADLLRFLLLLVHLRQNVIQIFLIGALLVVLHIVEEPPLRVIHHLREYIRNIIEDAIAAAFPVLSLHCNLERLVHGL